VGFESSQWLSMTRRPRALGQACMGLWLSRDYVLRVALRASVVRVRYHCARALSF
jgi:hypothetical protein